LVIIEAIFFSSLNAGIPIIIFNFDPFDDFRILGYKIYYSKFFHFFEILKPSSLI